MNIRETINSFSKELKEEFPIRVLSLTSREFIPEDKWDLTKEVKYVFDDVFYNGDYIILYIE